MKRFLTFMGLALGMTISSHATLINSTTGPVGNLATPGAGLINFEQPLFPLGAFASLPFSVTSGSGTFTGTIQWLNSGGTACSGTNQCGSISDYGNSQVLSTYRGAGDVTASSNFATTLRITFTSGNVDEFGLLIRNNDSANASGVHTPALNYMVVNFVGGGSTTNQNLPNQFNDPNLVNFFGWSSPGQLIQSVDFVITGKDAAAILAKDIVTFDDLRMFNSGTSGPIGEEGPPNGGEGGIIPEPSTYALIGAGLAALAYARRRKQS
jgi:hypothetical protein